MQSNPLAKTMIVLAASAWFIPAGAAAKPDVVIDDTNVYPESMSAASDGTLYVGSIKGIVFRAAPGSANAEPWIRPSADNKILTILGVLTDERSNTLWICSSPNSFATPPVTGVASLMAFNLKTGTQKGIYPFPAPASVCNDITVAKNGDVYVTDTPNGRILKLAGGAKVRAAKRGGAENLVVYADDPALKGIDGIVFDAHGVLYADIVSKNLLVRVAMTKTGAGAITTLTTSAPVIAPDGFRLIADRTFLLAEGNAGRIDEVIIKGDAAQIKVLKEGLISPPAVTVVGRTAYALEGKIGYLFDPKLKGQDPGQFKVYAVPLDATQ